MSNQIVGNIYAQIMDKVISASQNDFEESGVDQQTLQELKETWQKKLSTLHVAHFPWDPAPAQAVTNPPTVPSNAPKPEASPVPSSASTPQTNNYGGARIKTENTGYETPLPPYQMNGLTSGLNQGLAQQRAAALLQRNYGQQADAAIAAGGLNQHTNLALPGQQRPVGLQLPAQNQQPPRPQAPQVSNRSANVYNGQTDGPDDIAETWSMLSASQDGPFTYDRLLVDKMFRLQVEQNSELMSSGLMVPLDARLQFKKRATRMPNFKPTYETHHPPGQLDGLFEEDEDDKKPEVKDDEAINSDLDDPEDDLDRDQEGGDDMMDTMLCTYDKVQRVKNKWKCTLKDGVLTTGGKDYLFHKATGEFEW